MTLFDPGLQPERTELAWRRTALAMGVGSLVAARLLPVTLGDPWWAFLGIAGLVVSVLIWSLSRRRARRTMALLLREGDRAALAGGGATAAMAVVVTAIGVVGAVVVLVAALP